MEHAKTCQRPISLERRLAATYLVAGLVTAGLAGCAAGPDFQRPTAPDVARYTATPVADRTASAPTQFGETQRLVEGLPIETQWWQSLGSSALDGLINEAFHVSPTLASISANLRQAQELLAAQAGSTQYPQVDVALGSQRQQMSPSSQGLSGDARQFSLYNASVGVHYNLDLAGGNRRALEALAARADYRRFELNAARLALAGNMATAAITRARLAAQLEATTAILRVQDEQLRLAHERVRIGQASPDEALSLQAQAEQTRAELPALRKQLQQTEHLLAVLAGRAPGTGGIPAFTLAVALRELGRIERTLFILDWLQSVELRRRVHAGLNKGEARNALARAVFFNRLGEIRDRSFEQQRYRASGLNLVTAAIVLWNTVYLERATHGLRGTGHAVDDVLLQYLSPLGWEHINLTGDYLWRSSAKIGAGKFRPLRALQPA